MSDTAMAELNETPRGNRIHIAFFGLRNAGKSTLVNAFTGQSLAIVSDVAGTTTDPVSKAMEILPLGPCLVTDTAGLDDEGALGQMRVEKTLKVLEATDVAVWVHGADAPGDERSATHDDRWRERFHDACRRRKVTVLEYRRGDSVEELKGKIAALKLADDTPGLLDGLVTAGDTVVCVCPIDAAAPKGRLILPQVQLIRDALDRHATAIVCQPEELKDAIERANDRPGESARRLLVVTDSQAFGAVSQTIRRFDDSTIRQLSLTSFSILFARQKGDLDVFRRGLDALATLKDGDTVLVAEGCTHHRQCGDIGSVKIPKALKKLTGKDLRFVFASGGAFFDACPSRPALVVHCGGCMLTRRAVLARLAAADAAGIPVVNYGMLLSAAAGLRPGTGVAVACAAAEDVAAPAPRTVRVLGVEAEVCTRFLDRARGLIGRRSLPRGKGMLITRCKCIHTFFMRFAIDATFLDRDGRVVRTVRNIRPWRPLVWGGWRAKSVLETAAEEIPCGN